MSALDADSRHSLQDDLLRWHHTVPGTTIHVTHDGYEAMRMADRIAILDGGRITQFDSPSTIYRRPHDLAVAKAIGSPSINLIPAGIENGRLISRDPSVKVTFQAPDHGPDRNVLIGIRPESLRAVAEEPPCEVASFQGIEIGAKLVELREGIREHSVRAELDSKPIHGIVEDPTNLAAQIGKIVRLRAPAAKLHLFDASSGKRLRHEQE